MRNKSIYSYLFSLAFILVLWYGIGYYASGSLLAAFSGDMRESGPFSFLWYAAVHSWFLFLGTGTLVSATLVLGFTITSFITSQDRIRWKRLLTGIAGWLLLMAFATLAAWLLLPESGAIHVSVRPRIFLLFIPAALLAVTVQAGSEELFFRVFIGRFLTSLFSGSHLTKFSRRLLISALSGLLFLLVHLRNPEIGSQKAAWAMFLYYFLFGFLLMLLSLRDGGYELAIGIHIGNNLFTSLLVNYEGSVMPTPSLFLSSDMNPYFAVAALVIGFFCVELWRTRCFSSRRTESEGME